MGTIFDSSTKSCIKPNPSCAGGKIYNTNTGICECPSSQPYWNGIACLSCANSQHWSLIESKCVECPSNYFWNKVSGKCESCPAGTTLDIVLQICKATVVTCPGGQTYSTLTSKCECPSSLPHWTGSSCIGCPVGSFWSSISLRCFTCQAN